jgi:hypothetical protein
MQFIRLMLSPKGIFFITIAAQHTGDEGDNCIQQEN